MTAHELIDDLLDESLVPQARLSARDFDNGVIYVLHFDHPYKHAGHYIGWAHDFEQFKRRLQRHRTGQGSKLMRAVTQAYIPYRIVYLQPGDRNEERRMKNYNRGSRFCWICQQRTKSLQQKLVQLTPIAGTTMEAADDIDPRRYAADVPGNMLAELR